MRFIVLLVLLLSSFCYGKELGDRRVLYIGDSLSGKTWDRLKFSQAIRNYLKEENYTPYMYSVSSSSFGSWLKGWSHRQGAWFYENGGEKLVGLGELVKTPKLEVLLDKIAPRKVIIQLGTNNLVGLAKGQLLLERQVESFLKLIEKAGTEKCYFILPPDTNVSRIKEKDHDSLNRVIIEAIEENNRKSSLECFFYHSYEKLGQLTESDSRDGLHFTKKNSSMEKCWYEEVIDWLGNEFWYEQMLERVLYGNGSKL